MKDHEDDYFRVKPVFDLENFCSEIYRLQVIERAYNKLTVEHDKLKKDYNELLASGVKHNNDMMGNFLKLALEAGEEVLTKAFDKK